MEPQNDPASQATKPGWQTSEMYVGVASALAVVLGKLTDVQSIVVGIVAIVFILSRAYSKGVVARGAAYVAVSKEDKP